MLRLPVVSSHLKSVGYDPASSTLEVEFTDRHVYRYAGVPARVHGGLMAAPSKGKYFHAHIQEAYPYVRVL